MHLGVLGCLLSLIFYHQLSHYPLEDILHPSAIAMAASAQQVNGRGWNGSCCCSCGGLFRNPFIRLAAFLDKIGCDGGHSILSNSVDAWMSPGICPLTNKTAESEGRGGNKGAMNRHSNEWTTTNTPLTPSFGFPQ